MFKYITHNHLSVMDRMGTLADKVDFYDLTLLKYLFTIPSLVKGPRLINSLNVVMLERKYNVKLNASFVYSPASAHLLKEIEEKSVAITIESAGVKFKQPWESSVRDGVEKTGYVAFDGNNRRLYFEEIMVKNATGYEAADPYQAGQSLSYNNMVMANVHTHPKEHLYLGKRLAADPSKRVDDAYSNTPLRCTQASVDKADEILFTVFDHGCLLDFVPAGATGRRSAGKLHCTGGGTSLWSADLP